MTAENTTTEPKRIPIEEHFATWSPETQAWYCIDHKTYSMFGSQPTFVAEFETRLNTDKDFREEAGVAGDIYRNAALFADIGLAGDIGGM